LTKFRSWFYNKDKSVMKNVRHGGGYRRGISALTKGFRPSWTKLYSLYMPTVQCTHIYIQLFVLTVQLPGASLVSIEVWLIFCCYFKGILPPPDTRRRTKLCMEQAKPVKNLKPLERGPLPFTGAVCCQDTINIRVTFFLN
jgi:hypothetical protein